MFQTPPIQKRPMRDVAAHDALLQTLRQACVKHPYAAKQQMMTVQSRKEVVREVRTLGSQACDALLMSDVRYSSFVEGA